MEVRIPKDWFGNIGSQHLTKYPLAIRVTDIDTPPSSLAASGTPSAAYLQAMGYTANANPAAAASAAASADLKQSIGAGPEGVSVTAGGSFSSTVSAGVSVSGASSTATGAVGGPPAPIPCYGVELTILQLTVRPGEYAPQLARAASAAARRQSEAKAAAAAAGDAGGAAPDSKSVEMTRMDGSGAQATSTAAANAPSQSTPASRAAAKASGATSTNPNPDAGGAAAAAGGAIVPVVVPRSELDKLLCDTKIDQQLVFTDQTFLTCLDIYGLDEGGDEAADCIACLSEPKDIILLPCRHVNVCHTCFENLKICPICRSPILNHMRFMSPAQMAYDRITTHRFAAADLSPAHPLIRC